MQRHLKVSVGVTQGQVQGWNKHSFNKSANVGLHSKGVRSDRQSQHKGMHRSSRHLWKDGLSAAVNLVGVLGD